MFGLLPCVVVPTPLGLWVGGHWLAGAAPVGGDGRTDGTPDSPPPPGEGVGVVGRDALQSQSWMSRHGPWETGKPGSPKAEALFSVLKEGTSAAQDSLPDPMVQ